MRSNSFLERSPKSNCTATRFSSPTSDLKYPLNLHAIQNIFINTGILCMFSYWIKVRPTEHVDGYVRSPAGGENRFTNHCLGRSGARNFVSLEFQNVRSALSGKLLFIREFAPV